MGTVVGVLIVAAAIGFGVYKGFVDPSYVPHSGKSRAWTQSCSEGDDALAIDEELTEQLAVEAAPLCSPSASATEARLRSSTS